MNIGFAQFARGVSRGCRRGGSVWRFTTSAWLSVALLGGGGVRAGEDGSISAFEAANRLYEQGKHAEAAEAYETLTSQGQVSANLCFNLGNASFKAGQLGKAIVHYRLAARLAPRDPDIEANLRMVREVALGAPPPNPPVWQRIIRGLTLNEWSVLAGTGLWVFFVLLTLRELQPFRRGSLPRWLALWGTGTLVVGIGLVGAWLDRQAHDDAVVTVAEAVIRYGPLDISPQLEAVNDGAELVVLDRKDDWLQVSGLKRGVPGWIRCEDVTLVPR